MKDSTRGTGEHLDTLREGLVVLCRQLGCPTSVAELGDGLALEQGCLPLELVPRALRRAGVSARVINADLEALTEELLPALLLLEDGHDVVLVAQQAGEAVILTPESDGGQARMPLAQLKARHAGTVVVARPEYHPDERAGNFAREDAEHWFKGPLKRRWKTFGEVGVAAMMANMLAISTALFAMQVYDRVVPNEAFETLWILASGVALAVLMEFILRCLRGHLLDVTGKGLDLQLSSLLFERVMQMRLSAKPASTGAFSSQIREFESVREFFTSSTIGAISDMPFVLLFLGVIFFIGGPVVWVPIAAVVLMILPGLLAQGRLAKLSRQNLREGAVRQGVLLESVEHLETVKATRAEGRNLWLWENLSGDLSEASVRLRSLSVMLGYGASMVQQLCYVGVVLVGVYQISAGNMTIGALIACTILTSRTVAPMTQVAGILARWQHVKVAMEGLDELMNAPVERPAGRDFAHKPKLHGHYRLDKVIQRYQPDSPEALNLKTLEIGAGEHVALLGGNGAGKSTLLRLMAGLTDADSGRLLLDDVGLGQIEPVDRRKAIGYLPQDIALFYGTLRDNLTLDGAAYVDEELMEALDAVGLGAFVRAHSLGLDLPIPSSSSVSGGQRQAIGLARLLLQDPPIVLMDEPTAAFDQSNEQRVIRYLKHWLEGRTLVVSTHKRALLTLVERAIVLRDGRIVMDGPRDNVVSGNRVKAPPRPRAAGEGQDEQSNADASRYSSRAGRSQA